MLFVILALGLGLSYANAQKIKEANLPAPVKETLYKKYSDLKHYSLEKEGANYELVFEQNETEVSVIIDKEGNVLEVETEIKIADLPKAVSEYVTKNYPNRSIREASKITNPKGDLTFEAEIKEGDLIFDSNGVFIKINTK